MQPERAKRKRDEAAYFLAQLPSRDHSPQLGLHEEFGFHLSAFLSAARSIWQVLQKHVRPTLLGSLQSSEANVDRYVRRF